MNQETVALIESSQGWRELANAAASGRTPQSVGVVIPHIMQETFSEMYGRLVLGDDDLWKDGEHPDMINAGTVSSAPSIDECRRLQGELALHPLSSRRRLAVVWLADKLSVEASNSLLKITEEPPEHGNILFMSEEDNLIPTIKSRIWSIHIDLPEEILKAHPMPASIREWAKWMDAGRKPSPEILYLDAGLGTQSYGKERLYKSIRAGFADTPHGAEKALRAGDRGFSFCSIQGGSSQ